jgi:hypothetical protein
MVVQNCKKKTLAPNFFFLEQNLELGGAHCSSSKRDEKTVSHHEFQVLFQI